MIKHFPEIEQFFKNSSFTQEELQFFVQEIDKKYVNKDLQLKAHTLIKLELFKFQIKETNDVDKNEIQLNENSIRKDKKKSIETKPKKKIKADPFENRNNFVSKTLSDMRTMSISQISEILDVSPKFIERIIRRTGEDVPDLQDQTKEVINYFKDYAQNRLKLLSRRDKKYKIQKHTKAESQKDANRGSNSVYAKLQLHGPGKIIYIKSK